MKYMLLIHQGTTPLPGTTEWDALSPDQQGEVYAAYGAINQTPGFTPGVQMQSPETATAVVGELDCLPFGSETLRGLLLPEIFATKASTWPFVSPEARFEAAERKPTQVGELWKAPSIEGEKEGPLAGP